MQTSASCRYAHFCDRDLYYRRNETVELFEMRRLRRTSPGPQYRRPGIAVPRMPLDDGCSANFPLFRRFGGSLRTLWTAAHLRTGALPALPGSGLLLRFAPCRFHVPRPRKGAAAGLQIRKEKGARGGICPFCSREPLRMRARSGYLSARSTEELIEEEERVGARRGYSGLPRKRSRNIRESAAVTAWRKGAEAARLPGTAREHARKNRSKQDGADPTLSGILRRRFHHRRHRRRVCVGAQAKRSHESRGNYRSDGLVQMRYHSKSIDFIR